MKWSEVDEAYDEAIGTTVASPLPTIPAIQICTKHPVASSYQTACHIFGSNGRGQWREMRLRQDLSVPVVA